MSAFSFSHFSSFHLCVLLVVVLFHSCLSNQNFDDVLCIKEERQALLEFKHHLIDEGNRLSSWVDEKNDCCKWAGIVCDNMTGHVHQIHLPGLNGHCQYEEDFDTRKEIEGASKQKLKGELSPSLLGLKQLKHLDLSCNDFGWIQVPEFIGSLGNLRYLNLSSSNFSGLIPPQLGNISNLHTLCLGSFQDWNYESTRVMNMEWLSNLGLLRHLDMSFIDLRKAMDWFQVINTLPSLAELHLRYSNLFDAHLHVPTLNITSLLLLDLSENQFTNSLMPRWIFSITSLVSLDLSWCDFNGLIPSSSAHSFRNLTSLKWLHVSGNNFMNSSFVLKELSSGSGSNLISLHISGCDISSTALDSLLSLGLSSNQLTNIIPKSLGNFCNLRDIDLSYNSFQNISLTSLLESFLECKSPRLESLSISESGLSGTIPDSIRLLSFLRTLDLSENQISGPIPFSIGRLSVLEVLYLGDNQLNGSLPDSIGRLSLLKRLDLSDNQFNGSLPNSLGQLSKLEELDFSSNFLTGVVTETHFVKLVHLKYLYGEGNNLILRPRLANWIPPFQLEYLFLNSWSLGPKFPSWLILQRDLVYLEISNTNISSHIPESLNSWSLGPDLSLNKLSGELPMSLSSLNLLSSFNVSHNNLTGKIPSSTQLQSFNESCFVGNKLCGDPLSDPCSRVETTDIDHEEDDGSHGVDWGFIISVVSGFIVGFWVILAPLIVIRSWRIAYFRVLNDLRYMLYDVMHKMFSW